MKNTLLVLAGAAAGGIVGYYAFLWAYHQGFYALILPGGMIGVGAGLAKNQSVLLAVVCGVAALALGLFAEWSARPFSKDESFGYLVTHVTDLTPITLIMLAVGTIIGFYIPFSRAADAGRRRGAW